MAKRIENATTGKSYSFEGTALSGIIIDPQIARAMKFDEESVQEKIVQFQDIGQETPILIRLVNKEVRVVDGRNRFEAARRVHEIQEAADTPKNLRFKLWAVERHLDDKQALIASLAANRTRPTTVIDLAHAANEMTNQGNSQEEAAEMFRSAGISMTQSRVSKLLVIHTQPASIKQMMARGQLRENALDVLLATINSGNMTNKELPKIAEKIISGEVNIIAKLRSTLNEKAREKGKRRDRTPAEIKTFLQKKDTEKSRLFLAFFNCEMTNDDPPQELANVSDVSRIFDD